MSQIKWSRRFLVVLLSMGLALNSSGVVLGEAAAATEPTVAIAEGENAPPLVGTDTKENSSYSEDSLEDIDLYHDYLNRISLLGTLPEAPRPETSQENLDEVYAQEDLPSVYDPRTLGLVTPPKDQGSYGLCWAFATTAMMESSLLKQNLGTFDLSEEHLAYFFANRENDPLGNTEGDKNIRPDTSATAFRAGGNKFATSLFLSTWSGLADESLAPYPASGNPTSVCTPEMAYQTTAYAKDCIFTSHYSVDFYKSLIYKYGGLIAGVRIDEKYYNLDTFALCTAGTDTTSNHAVLLVGWDDTYSKENFLEESGVTEDGAFIVKNSWGEEAYDGGYFHISYEDLVLSNCLCSAISGTTAPAYPNNYFYDGTGSYGWYKLSPNNSDSSIANVFQAKASENACEALGEVVLTDYSDGSHYEIQIYTNLTDLTDPTSGVPAFQEPFRYDKPYSGYETVTLPSEVILLPGSYYSVVVTNVGTENVYYLVDKDVDWEWIRFENKTRENISFHYDSASGRWIDFYEEGKNPRIKAHTRTLTDSPSLTLSTSEMTLRPGETKPLIPSVSAGEGGFELDFTSSDTSVATVSDAGLVTGLTQGTATISCSLKGVNVNLTACASVTVISSGKCGENLTWTLDKDSNLVIQGTGEMESYYVNNAIQETPWGRNIKHLVVEEGVTSLSDCSFYGCIYLEDVSLPESLVKFEPSVFRKCIKLKEVTIPKNISVISSYLFAGCISLQNVTIPEGVTIIRWDSFGNCDRLTTLNLPDTVTRIDGYAFYSCDRMESINIPDAASNIAKGAFCNCKSLKELTLPTKVKTINDYTFSGCSSLESLLVPGTQSVENVTNVNAFENCTKLTIFGESGTYIETYAKENYIPFKLISEYPVITPTPIPFDATPDLTLPASLQTIEEEAFLNCKAASIKLQAGVISIEKRAFAQSTQLGQIKVPSSVTFIADDAFDGSEGITIYCASGSYAYQYAKEHEMKYVFE